MAVFEKPIKQMFAIITGLPERTETSGDRWAWGSEGLNTGSAENSRCSKACPITKALNTDLWTSTLPFETFKYIRRAETFNSISLCYTLNTVRGRVILWCGQLAVRLLRLITECLDKIILDIFTHTHFCLHRMNTPLPGSLAVRTTLALSACGATLARLTLPSTLCLMCINAVQLNVDIVCWFCIWWSPLSLVRYVATHLEVIAEKFHSHVTLKRFWT